MTRNAEIAKLSFRISHEKSHETTLTDIQTVLYDGKSETSIKLTQVRDQEFATATPQPRSSICVCKPRRCGRAEPETDNRDTRVQKDAKPPRTRRTGCSPPGL